MGKKIILAFIAAALAGCAGSKQAYTVSPSLRNLSDGRISVLPFDNQSTDVTAPDILRAAVAKRLAEWGYSPSDSEETDLKLKKLGVSEGGQLPSVKAKDIGAATGTDLLCYGDVEDFAFQNIGFVVKKNVRLRLRIISASSGEVLFESAGEGRDVKVYMAPDEAKKAFIEASAMKLVQNILKSPLKKEAETAVRKIFDRLPRR